MPHDARLARHRALLADTSQLRRSFWDAVVLTASSDAQAASFRERLDALHDAGALPGERERYVCVADPAGGRIGSGGATIRVAALLEDWFGDAWRVKKIFVLHTGGYSERAPQHGSCGKAFAEVPMDAAGIGMPATILEAQLVQLSAFARALPPGMFVSSADVLIEYGDIPGTYDKVIYEAMERGITALGHPSSLEVGASHGVFVCDKKEVRARVDAMRAGEERAASAPLMCHRCLQKPNAQVMADAGAVLVGYNDDDDVWVLTDSAFHIGVEACEVLIALARTKGDVLVGCEIDAYGDFMQPLGCDADLSYLNRVDHLASVTSSTKSDGAERLQLARRTVADVMRGRPLVIIPLLPSRFIHLGTIPEFLHHTTTDEQCLRMLPAPNAPVRMASYVHQSTKPAPQTAIMLSSISDGVIIESGACLIKCSVKSRSKIGERCVLYDVDLAPDSIVPPDTFMYTLPLTNGCYVTFVLDVNDIMKCKTTSTLLGRPIEQAVNILGDHKKLPEDGVWAPNEAHTTTLATVFGVFDTSTEAVRYALQLARVLRGEDTTNRTIGTPIACMSIARALRAFAHHAKILARHKVLRREIVELTVLEMLDSNTPAGEWTATAERRHLLELGKQYEGLNAESITHELSTMMKGYQESSADLLRARTALSLQLPHAEIVAQRHLSAAVVRLAKCGFGDALHCSRSRPWKFVEVHYPARLNLAGGWTDTPPYSLERPGCVLHVPCLVNGRRPIITRASLIDADRPLIRFIMRNPSTGEVTTEEVREMKDLFTYTDPKSRFALHKAVLVFFLYLGHSDSPHGLQQVFHVFNNNGLELNSCVDLPQGSGLGTSSILAFAMLHSLYELSTGKPWSSMNNSIQLPCEIRRSPNDQELGNLSDSTRSKLLSFGDMTNAVLAIEQLLTTGGGWQDQVGGGIPGIHLSDSTPLFRKSADALPSYSCDIIDFTPEAKAEINRRVVCVFTGTCRLAKGVCDSVVKTWQRRESGVESALQQCAILAQNMFSILLTFSKRTEFDTFEGKSLLSALGELLKNHKEVQRRLWPSIESPEVKAIYDALDPLCEGTFICGAGSGGHIVGFLKPSVDYRSCFEAVRSSGVPGAVVVDVQLIL